MKKSYKAKYATGRVKTPWTKGPVNSGPYYTLRDVFGRIKPIITSVWFGLCVSIVLLGGCALRWSDFVGFWWTLGWASLVGSAFLGLVSGCLGCICWYLINKLAYVGPDLRRYESVPDHVWRRVKEYNSFIPGIPVFLCVVGAFVWVWDNHTQAFNFLVLVQTALFKAPIIWSFFGFMLGIGVVAAVWEYHLFRPHIIDYIKTTVGDFFNVLVVSECYLSADTFNRLLRVGWVILRCWAAWALLHLYFGQLLWVLLFIRYGSWDSIYLGVAFGGGLAALLGLLYGAFYCWVGTSTKSSTEASDDFFYRVLWKLLPEFAMGWRYCMAALLTCALAPIIFGLYPVYFLVSFYTFGVGHNIYVFWFSVFGTLYAMRGLINLYWYSNEVIPWLIDSFTGDYIYASIKNSCVTLLLVVGLGCLCKWYWWVGLFVAPLVHMTYAGFWAGFICGFGLFVCHAMLSRGRPFWRWWLPGGVSPKRCAWRWPIWPYWFTHRRMWYLVGGCLLFLVVYPVMWLFYTYLHPYSIPALVPLVVAGGPISFWLSMYCGFMFGALFNWLYWMWPFIPTRIRYWLCGLSISIDSRFYPCTYLTQSGRRKPAMEVRTRIIKRRGNRLLRAFVLPRYKIRRSWCEPTHY